MHLEHIEVTWCAEESKRGPYDEGALLLLEQLDGAASDLGRLCLEAPQLPLVRLHPALPCTHPHLCIQALAVYTTRQYIVTGLPAQWGKVRLKTSCHHRLPLTLLLVGSAKCRNMLMPWNEATQNEGPAMAALQEGFCLQHLQLKRSMHVAPKQGERASGEDGNEGVGVGQAGNGLGVAQAAVEKQPRRGRPHVGDLRQRHYLLLHSRQRA